MNEQARPSLLNVLDQAACRIRTILANLDPDIPVYEIVNQLNQEVAVLSRKRIQTEDVMPTLIEENPDFYSTAPTLLNELNCEPMHRLKSEIMACLRARYPGQMIATQTSRQNYLSYLRVQDGEQIPMNLQLEAQVHIETVLQYLDCWLKVTPGLPGDVMLDPALQAMVDVRGVCESGDLVSVDGKLWLADHSGKTNVLISVPYFYSCDRADDIKTLAQMIENVQALLDQRYPEHRMRLIYNSHSM